jgi:hypothetical protein
MMTEGWNSLRSSEQACVAEVLAALAIADDLFDEPVEREHFGLTAAQVFAFASDPEIELDDETRQDLARHPRLAELFQGVIRDNPTVAFPRAAAAADDGAVDRRLADGFRVRLVPSRSTAGQTYVIIDLPLGRAAPASSLFIVRADEMPWKIRLPQPMHGQIQLLAENSSPLVIGLRDPGAEVFLR